MKFIISLMILFTSFLSLAHIGPNTYAYQVLVTDKTTSTVTEKSFNKIPMQIFAINYLRFQKNKINVTVNPMWEKPFFSAWVVDEAPNKYAINIWGGISRINGMNDNGLAFIMCHEVGHLLGGRPFNKLPAFTWASSEGQSDYYATSVCMKDYYSFLEKLGKLEDPDVPNTLYTMCKTKYDETKDFLICLNIMDGINAFSKVLKHLDPEKKDIVFTKKSPRAKETNTNSYPSTQCRIEILLAGNFCAEKDFPCIGKDSARPQCWFVD